ncbi:hypothetical protein HanRHA438_Chr08g0367901 [Helianthus annuus]|uniref:Uncharacterized protein n=1 Tax=Helianthus annuus TaxID=4232 RepID=A0A9K3IH40_HELAN|nr:hypothetical protein HanXRQr2_Chr08g0355691 [Helianthus annuus]KAJ0899381.1 hypothetical protein HanRHA438_Chr08g0367901 [Helianthus annuus]KAJ0902962.1 hypothetical protein HanPSC8_Chr08g0343471 [Helianthus annuus]
MFVCVLVCIRVGLCYWFFIEVLLLLYTEISIQIPTKVIRNVIEWKVLRKDG